MTTITLSTLVIEETIVKTEVTNGIVEGNELEGNGSPEEGVGVLERASDEPVQEQSTLR